MQGLKFKSLFFSALLIICLLRTLCLIFMTFKFSSINKDTDNDELLNMMIRLALDLPTIMMISVFSAFSYYLSQLNLEIEAILHQIDDHAGNNPYNSRSIMMQNATHQNHHTNQSTAANVGLQNLAVHGNTIRENTTGFAKMSFIIANVLLFIFYIVCFVKYYDSISEGESESFDKWVRTFTGVSFLVLGVSILKYGSQLETTITHSINLKSSMAAQMEGLDIRILSITILLSLIFLSRALVDCMFAFNLINEQLNSFVMLLCIIIFSEVCTSMAIVKLMKKGGGKQSTATQADVDGSDNFLRAVGSKHSLDGRRRIGGATISNSEKDHHKTTAHSRTRSEGVMGHMSTKDNLNDSCSSYGSFNPNLDSGMPSAPTEGRHTGLHTPDLQAAIAYNQKGQKMMHRQNKSGQRPSQNYRQFLAANEYLDSSELLLQREMHSNEHHPHQRQCYKTVALTNNHKDSANNIIVKSTAPHNLLETRDAVKLDFFGMPMVMNDSDESEQEDTNRLFD